MSVERAHAQSRVANLFEFRNMNRVGDVCVYMFWGSICVAAKQLKIFRGWKGNG